MHARRPLIVSLIKITVALITPFDARAGEDAKGWYLIEPPVDENIELRAWGFGSGAPIPMEAHCVI